MTAVSVPTVDRRLVAPGSAHRLACVRTGLAVVIGLRVALGPYRELAGQPSALFRPPWFLEWLDSMPSAAVMVAVQVVGATAAAVAVAGRRRAGAFAVAWLSLLFLAGLRGSLGKVLHNDVLLLLAAVPVLLAPGDARVGDARRSGRWGWPVRAAMLVIAAVYFATGVQKLRHSGLDWVTSDNFRWVLYGGAASGLAPTTGIARAIADRLWLAQALGAGLLAFELTAPVLVVWRRLRPLFVAGAAALHGATWLLLGLDYWAWLLTVAVVLAPWDRVR